MTSEIRICQFLQLETTNNQMHRYQNYFLKVNKNFKGASYSYVPFEIEGGVSSLNADNQQITVRLPATEYAVRLVEEADGNRLSKLLLYTRFITAAGFPANALTEDNVGILPLDASLSLR